MELKNKVVVITGGTKGLGKALAISFLKSESRVVVCSNNEGEIRNIDEEGIIGIKADVTREEELINLFNIVIEKFGQIDIWINNAGIWLPHMPIEDVDWNKAHELMEVNLFGTVYGSKVALTQMREQGFGVIVNVISTRALEGKALCSAYCASKFAVEGFTECLKQEVIGTAIKIISIYPEQIKTDLFVDKIPDDYSDYMDSDIAASLITENLKKDKPNEKQIIKKNI